MGYENGATRAKKQGTTKNWRYYRNKLKTFILSGEMNDEAIFFLGGGVKAEKE